MRERGPRAACDRCMSAIAIDRQAAFAHELPLVIQAQMSSRTIELDTMRDFAGERIGDPKRIEPERIETGQRWAAEFSPRKLRKLRRVGSDYPGNVDHP